MGHWLAISACAPPSFPPQYFLRQHKLWGGKEGGAGTFTLSEHKGEVVVLYFMASWCGSCVPEARSLATLYEQYKEQGLTVVAINLEPQANKAELSKFRELADNAAYTWAFDTTFAVAQAYQVQTLDATVIIDGSGRIAYQDTMPTPLDTLEAELQKWLPAAGG